MRSLSIFIDIESPQIQVWETLVDFENYHAWSPRIDSLKGNFSANGSLVIRLKSQSDMVVDVVSVEEGDKYVLSRNIMHKKIVHMLHHYELSQIGPNTTRLTQKWCFSGWFVPILWSVFTSKVKGFKQANIELKKYIEAKQEINIT